MVEPTVSPPPSGTAATPAPSGSPSTAAPAKGRPSFVRRVVAYWLPPTSDRVRRADGLQSTPGPDGICWLIAAALGLLGAYVFETLATAPVPPGGDPSQWLLLSFPYVGLPYPSEIGIFSYPPLSFPFIGVSVILGGGPLLGGKIYVGAIIVALGLSFYHLGRSMFRFRSVALLAEAALLIQPDWQQLYYFGAYPNLFGFVFMFLTVSFALRFVRSRRPAHLAAFWACLTIAILSHALVAVLTVALVGIAGVLLLFYRRLPRELITSKLGIGSALVCGFFSLLYYLGATRLGFSPPNYLATNVLTSTKSTQALQTAAKPLYLENLAKFFDGSGFNLTYLVALQLYWEVIIALVAAFVIARFLVPRDVTHRAVFLAAWILSVFGVALFTWYSGLTADYRRFAYFLYPVLILVFGLGSDVVLVFLWDRWGRGPDEVDEPVPFHLRQRTPWRWRRWDRRQIVVTAAIAGTCVFLVWSVDAYTVPTAQGFATNFTGADHSQDLVNVMEAVAHSGIPGSILSVTGTVDRWPATITSRNLYETRPPTGFTYAPENLVQDEQASMTTSARYTVTNGLVEAAIPGVAPVSFTSSPLYSLYTVGVAEPVYKIIPGQVYVQLVGGTEVPVWSKANGPPTVVLPSNPSNGTIEVLFQGTGWNVTETIEALPNTASLSIAFVAHTTNATARLAHLRLALTGTGNKTDDNASSSDVTHFAWSTFTPYGTFGTNGTVLPGASVTAVVNDSFPLGAPPGAGPAPPSAFVVNTVSIEAIALAGAPTLSLGFVSTTPGATNTATGIGGLYSAPVIWAQWQVVFVLFENGSASSGPVALAYFEAEYAATVFSISGVFTVAEIASLPPE